MNTRFLPLLALLSFASACSSTPEDPPASRSPIGPVARTAAEAFPGAPSGVPALDRETILAACARAGECQVGQPLDDGVAIDPGTALDLVLLCVDALEFSAERAIPVSGWSNRMQTADRWAACVQGAAACEGVRACDIEREGVSCQEDGCLGPAGWKETRCEGDKATLIADGGIFTRDCALAHATCDTASPTGCTDRPYTACPPELPRADRCEGNIRLGCDGQDQVSYRDCTRLGGTCGLTPQGTQGCIYPGTTADCSGSGTPPPSCQGTRLSACVLGGRVEVDAPTLCP
jgi:hypothetical protein